MASLAEVAMPTEDIDDAPMMEDEDATEAASELAAVLGLDSGKTEALKSALTAFVLSVR